MSKNVTRLFGQLIPQHYDLQIEIAEDKKSFTGEVTILGSRKSRPSKRLTLHQKKLHISEAKLFRITKTVEEELSIDRVVSHKTKEELRLHTSQDLQSGDYKISLKFSGKITRNMEGVYPCFYTDDGVEKQLIATQFESHHAREVFPCIDEPEAKATFSLTLIHASDEIAISNTPVKSTAESSGRTITTYEKTPIMSTYLLAFVIGDLAYKEARSTKNNILIRTYATKHQIEHTEFALEIAVKCMDFYEEYYAIPFPLPKCDFVALPDFASGAMENWGLITFREQAMLYDPANTSLGARQYVALVVAHELTHQWFGNLVTMRWWTDLWLNEGFASWMEYLAIDHFYPEWDLWTQFSVDEQQLALKLDALEHTHPIEVPIHHPDEIRTIFDAISYQKGASVIHMLEEYLGAEAFRDGLRNYLKKHAYSNTHTIDLWQSLEEVTGKPVKDFMHAWTSQAGFPLVKVSAQDGHYSFTQQRFVANPQSPSRQDSSVWPVPIMSDGIEHTVFTKRSQRSTVRAASKPYLINIGQTAFYRVDYDELLQQRQIAALEEGSISAIDRMGLLSDSIEVAKAGYQPVTDYLDLLAHYANEESLAVWEIIAGSIGSIRTALSKSDSDDTLRNVMKPFIRAITKKELARLGWEEKKGEKHLDTLLRPIIIGLNAGADDSTTVKKMLELYDSITPKTNPVHPDIRGIVYTTAARIRGDKEYERLLTMYKNTNSSDEKLSITAAMTSFEDAKTHEKVLSLLQSDVIRLQDVPYWIAYGFMNRHGRAATWQWVVSNWQWLRDNLGGDLSFSRMPVYAARTFGDEHSLIEYEKFFTAHMEPMLERSFKQGLEIAQTTVAWRSRDADAAQRWFEAHQQNQQ